MPSSCGRKCLQTCVVVVVVANRFSGDGRWQACLGVWWCAVAWMGWCQSVGSEIDEAVDVCVSDLGATINQSSIVKMKTLEIDRFDLRSRSRHLRASKKPTSVCSYVKRKARERKKAMQNLSRADDVLPSFLFCVVIREGGERKRGCQALRAQLHMLPPRHHTTYMQSTQFPLVSCLQTSVQC
jgi:hypothetical protein